MRFISLLLLWEILHIIGCYGDLNRIYTQDMPMGFCEDSGNDKFVELKNNTEKELLEQCDSFKYAEVKDCQHSTLFAISTSIRSLIKCCNVMNSNIVYGKLSTNAIEVPICTPLEPGTLYGASLGEFQTILELKPTWYSFQNYEFVACILKDVLVTTISKTPILALYLDFTHENIIQEYVNPSLTKFRIWDFGGDCHNAMYPDKPYPIGRHNRKSVAIYIQSDFNWKDMIIPSQANFDYGLNPIDKLFKQFVQVLVQPKDIILQEGDLNLTNLYAGKYACVSQCHSNNEKNTLDLAIISNDICYCTSYDALDKVLDVVPFDTNDDTCPDDPNSYCGSDGYVAVYHIDLQFGFNSGYKFWQAIQYPAFNDYKDKLEYVPNAQKITNSSSECLIFCEQNDFEIAILLNVEGDDDEEGNFDCFCMYPELYKFLIQDIAISEMKFFNHWCPDLDGPCVHYESSNEYKYAVVYCMDDSFCNEDLFLKPRNHDICIPGQKTGYRLKEYLSDGYYLCTKENKIRPFYKNMPCDKEELFYPTIGSCAKICNSGDVMGISTLNCSKVYYECQTNEDIEDDIWIKKKCPGQLIFSPKSKRCTQYCNAAVVPEDPFCNSNATHCRCLDDVEYFWEVEHSKRGEITCDNFKESLTGNKKFPKFYFNFKIP